jgi:hypothetical protein
LSISEQDLKFINSLYWRVKGQLIPLSWSEQDILKIEQSYFVRVWGNHENHIHLEGFEEAWRKRVYSSQ